MDKKIIKQILDYWFAIEFLGQDSYDACTNEATLVRELKQFKKSELSKRTTRAQICVFEPIDEENDIYCQIVKQAKECNMTTWGNITFYLGKIRRQECIEKLAQELGVKINQAEKNSDCIPAISFQCSMDGIYVGHSLSLSPILWTISQLEENNNGKLSDLLSSKAYSDTVEELEKILFGSENLIRRNLVEDDEIIFSVEDMPSFSHNSLTSSYIKLIHSKIVSMYGKFLHPNAIEEKNCIKYQLFKDQKAKEKYDDDNYMGLSHDFFSNDLKMVRESLDTEDYSTGMLADLVDYICAPYETEKVRRRHDFVKPKNMYKFYMEMAEILNVKNAPLGKWPSRYMPAFMQQIAINIAISDRQRGIFEENGNIFSVNGPPGTGKTTLLKEIIANDVVEKARFLSQYCTPDDAFEGVYFMHGKLDGAYARFYPKWFRFKNEHIANFGVLVTSCNNTAVENITRELPLEKGILENLKIIYDGDTPDAPEMIQQLEAIRALFSTTETDESLEIYKKDIKRQGIYPEIYYTGYAKKFFGNNEKDADSWGMVAAPLGKKSNISRFYYDVLNPIWQDFMMKNDDIECRIFEYKKSRKAFIEQLEVVQRHQQVLQSYADICIRFYQAKAEYKQIYSKNTSLIADYEQRIDSLQNNIVSLKNDIDKATSILSGLKEQYSVAVHKLEETEKRIEEMSHQEINYMKQALEAENSVSFFTRLFRKSKYQSALDLAATYRKKAKECENDVVQSKQSAALEREEIERHHFNKDNVILHIQALNNRVKEFGEKKIDAQNIIIQLNKEIDRAHEKAESARLAWKNSLEVYLNAGSTKTGKVLDPVFIEELLSEDNEVATKAHITNPWTTEEFNREREKLFYLALQMTKNFVLSSKSCRTNLCILSQYWGLRTEKGEEKIIFHNQDSEAMIGSLFQTLFLLVPVISSTFASVGRLLKDMKTPGSIGTLIIDEAGQAQPQMAVGALFRARKAIIVGDPKQVEPVVTDDLKLLKEAYSEPVLANYKDKSLSVQSCADIINPFGTFYDNGTNYPEWVGCPLIVHRRCISPMYEISNRISYQGLMKQQTLPPSDKKIASFIFEKSQWMNIKGTENGHGDHYVAEQGEAICKLVETAFQKTFDISKKKDEIKPSLYIISPFTSVVYGLRKAIGTYTSKNRESILATSKSLGEWLYDNIGTVHKFQGKEANEVIFVLGCDESQKDRYAVKGFVNSNIVNVAATRAKYRFCIVGDISAWERNEYVNEAKSIIDSATHG